MQPVKRTPGRPKVLFDASGVPVDSEALKGSEPAETDEDVQGENYSPYLSQRQRAFLAAFAQVGTVRYAADCAKLNRRIHQDWMQDPVFRRAFAQAKEEAAERLENEARRRAVEGVEEPTGWYKGQPGGYIQRYSDSLLIFLLKGAYPEKYRERIDNTWSWDGDISKLNDAQLQKLGEALLVAAYPDAAEREQAKKKLMLEAGMNVVDVTPAVEVGTTGQQS